MTRIFFPSILRCAAGALAAILLVAACSSTEKSSENNDSSPGGGTSISSGEADLKAPENLAPGTAQVRLKVEEVISGDEDQDIWVSEIREILGYGSATPPLAAGTELNIHTATYFSNVDAAPGDFADRDELICIIRHQKAFEGTGNSNSPSWSLVTVLEQLK
ncbi:hypothetical protein [Halalkalibaculum sp. DA384]|uniref:hypothetical protein n=1 Tax=Halalkalibaculum sp. DA384 TaxID=3373606 RepID=UPI003754455D